MITYSHRVVIDPGHGGVHPGAISRDGRMEKDGVLDIAFRVKQLLVADGFCEAIMTRSDDTHISLLDRCRLANKANAAAFISIHMNSCARHLKPPKGVEVYGYGTDSALAKCIHRGLIENMRPTPIDRGVRNGAKYTTICKTSMPSVVVECGFINNIEEVELLWDNTYRQLIAKGIAEGIRVFLHEKSVSELSL